MGRMVCTYMSMRWHLMSRGSLPDVSGVAAGAANGGDGQHLGDRLGDLRAGAAQCRVHHQMRRLAGVYTRLDRTAHCRNRTNDVIWGLRRLHPPLPCCTLFTLSADLPSKFRAHALFQLLTFGEYFFASPKLLLAPPIYLFASLKLSLHCFCIPSHLFAHMLT